MRRLLILALIALAAAPAMAAQQNIPTISSVTASREALRTAVNSRFSAIDTNFDELYAAIGTRPWVAQTTAPADTTLLWFDTDQVPGEVVLKIYTGGAWVAHSVGTGGTAVAALNDLTDVDTAGAVNGSVLKYNGSAWVVGADDVGTGSFSWPSSDGAYYAAKDGAWSSLTGVYQGADGDLSTLASPTNWRVFYSNGSGTITQLALGADGTYLKSNGVSSAPTWATPSTMVYPGAGVPQSTGSAWGASLTVGSSANNLLQLNGSGQIPAVPGTLLTDTYTGTLLSGQTTLHGAVQTLATELDGSVQATTAGNAIITAADYAAIRALLDLEPGVDFNAYDADLAAWAAISPATGNYETTGTIQGKLPFVSYSGNQTLTQADNNSSVAQFTAVANATLWDCTSSNVGDNVVIWSRDAEAVTLVPASGDQFVTFAGTGNGTNTNYVLPATAGLKVPLVCTSDNNWSVFTDPAMTTVATVTAQKEIGFTITGSTTATTIADGTQYFAVPASWDGMNLVDVACSVNDLNSAASGSTTVVVRRVRGNTAVDMTSTGVTIAYNEYTASDETVDTSNDDLATGDKVFFDVNAITSAAQKGLSCSAVFQKP